MVLRVRSGGVRREGCGWGGEGGEEMYGNQ